MGKLQLDREAEELFNKLVRQWKLDEKWEKEAKIKGKLEVAVNLLSKGMSLEEVSEVTGLPLDKLKNLG